MAERKKILLNEPDKKSIVKSVDKKSEVSLNRVHADNHGGPALA